MFTGIVEEIGVVSELNRNDSTGGTSLTVTLPAGSQLLSDAHEGDSIAVNGVCLTVVTFSHQPSSSSSDSAPPSSWFTVGIAPETLRLTDLGDLRASSRVNLERAVRADTRMGGHFVQGHVDTTCTVAKREPDGNALTMRFRPRDRAVLRYVVKKGFIALDGTSLTVTAVDDGDGSGEEGGWWEVMLISYTQGKVVLADKGVGDTVNVEVDVLAKYAEKSMSGIVDSLTGEGGLEQMIGKIVRQGLGGKP